MNNKKSVVIFLLIVSLLMTITSCANSDTWHEENSGKVKVVTTLFPLYDFAREIGGDKADIKLLLPPGIEPHSYEPSPKDIAEIKKAGMFIYTGQYMEPWADKIINRVKDKSVVIVDSSKGIELDDEEERDGDNDKSREEHQHSGGKDPHVWLDPVLAQKMVENIVEGFAKADPENEIFYKENGEIYKKKLQALDEKIYDTLSKAKCKKIIYGGHFAFGYFAKRYGLEYVSPYSGFAPNAEPTPQRIAELIKTMKETGLKTIYYEELVDPKVAKVIADQTGAKMLLLHGAHNVTKEQLSAGISYIKIMEDNLEKLKQGLVYNE